MNPSTYQSYKGLPSVAGVCSIHDAMRPGLSVEHCVRRLKRFHYAFKRLHEIFTARITAEPIYELKSAFSLHAYLCAEHVSALRKRVGEMREPPLGLDLVPDPNLEIFFDEILGSPSTEELIMGLYGKAVPVLQKALQRHMADTNPLVDQPSVRVCRFALLELADLAEFGKQAIQSLVSADSQKKIIAWLELLDSCLAVAGNLDGADQPSSKTINRHHSSQPYVYDRIPKRDERFKDSYNAGVQPESFLYNEKYPPSVKALMMFYKRIREIDVPEMMASIITETKGKPWEYYRDMSRQLWDEARHAIMGEVGFVNLGIDWADKIAVNFTWSLGLNTQLKPIERHAVLYFIEQGLMPRNGKRYEWEVGQKSKNPLSALFQDYDWADEVLHARIGRDWYLPEFKDAREGVKYGDQCWSRVLSHWSLWREKGFTQHRNWWPDLYREACKQWGSKPDPEILAYNENYENTRADLKNISASG